MGWNHRRLRRRGGRHADHKVSPPVDYTKTDIDELLELIYTLKESAGNITLSELRSKHDDDEDIDQLLKEMITLGLINMNDGTVSFSEAGKREAEKLIRAHRLAERLLIDVLLVQKDQDVESQACAMEHVLNPAVVDSICTILGHPHTCPHGHEIPPGPCCNANRREVGQVVQTLDQLRSGESGRILYIETQDHARLDKLTTFGMLPGTIVRVHQRQPSLVILVGETQLALDREIARNIHLVKAN